MTSRPIIIAGFMGAGKTTVAGALARKLHCDTVDLDELIAKKTQRTPGQIITANGETAFRLIETQLLKYTLENELARVIALGGGAWTSVENRDLMARHNALTVWLDVSFELCWQRILASGSQRPLAANELQARRLYAERRAFYELAELHLRPGADQAADQIAAEIAKALDLRRASTIP